jgi:thioredoxin-like negative regulator of GroEL
MKRLLLPLLLSLFGTAHAAEPDGTKTVAAALAAAGREHRPVLIDFQAQWCYSCYYMATHVLTGPQWQPLEARVRVTEVDADSPDGAAWMKKLGIKALPSYVVLQPDGKELGRIVAEQPPQQFYAALRRILGGGDALDALKAKAKDGAPAAVADVLASFHARDEIQAGLDWYAALPAAQRAAADKDARVALWHTRLDLEKAAKAKDDAACVSAAQRVLAGAPGCDRYYVVENLLECSEKQPAEARRKLLEPQRAPLGTLLDQQVFASAPQCADQRSAVLAAADLDKALGDGAAETAVLDRAIAFVRKALGDDYAKDRNLADNLRVYLMRAERTADIDALLPKLIAAYPDDYVYAYRYGRNLLDRKQPEQALKYLDQAAEKSFGMNRLAVAELRVKALLALKRRADAEKVVADALEANGPWFPEEAAKLKAMLKS